MSDDTAARARKCLDLGPTAPISNGLLKIFQDHFSLYPCDDNFLLNPKDPAPYGSITCLENNCNVDIDLERGATGDGGLADGVGSFRPFHDHIQHNESHRADRDKRVARSLAKGKGATYGTPAKLGGSSQGSSALLTPSSAYKTSSTAPIKRASPDTNSFDPKRVKPTAADPLVERNNNVPAVPASFAAARPARLPQIPGFLPQPAHYAQQVEAYRRELKRQEQILTGLRATGQQDGHYYDSIDAVVREMTGTHQMLQQLTKTYGPPLAPPFVAAGAPPPALPNVSAQALPANADASGSGIGARPAGATAPTGYYDATSIADASHPAFRDDDEEGEDEDGDYAMGDSGSEVDPLDVRFTGSSHVELANFLQAAAEGHDFEGNATVDEAMNKLGLATQKTPIENMAIPLMPHQIIGTAFMIDRENSNFYGGVIGDEMGLGKTVQTIACMAKMESQDPDEKTNLIIAPLALLNQWKEEIINKMAENHWKILVHHGAMRAKKVSELKKYDVVLTTYHTLAGEWPDEEMSLKRAKKGKKKAGGQYDSDEDTLTLKKPGPLFEMGWFRIILDEAQNIRNRSTKISRSVAQLDSLFRWCLTGTPVTNSLSDLYPLFRFLQVKPWYSWKDYREHVMYFEKKRPDIAGKRAQILLGPILIRRKKDTLLDGKPLITLPNKTVELQVLEFSAEEREIYSFIETRSQATFNKYLKQGTVLKNYAHVLVMLMRLRQCCLHPALLVDGFDALAADAKAEQKAADELVRAEKFLGLKVVEKFKKDRLLLICARLKAEQEGEETDEGDCPICLEPVGETEGGGVYTACGHSFCRECVADVLEAPAADEDVNDALAIKYKADQRPCPSCRQPISKNLLFNILAFDPTVQEIKAVVPDAAADEIDLELPSDEEEDEEEEAQKVVEIEEEAEDDGPAVRKSKKRAVVMDSDDEDEETLRASAAKAEKVAIRKKEAKQRELPDWMAAQEPSTKMKWLLAEIQRVEDKSPDDKFLVISQFTSALDMVDDYLNKNGVRVTRFQGDMKLDERDESVRILMKSKKCKVMLMSLKCGGVGLNLVRANHVVNMDLAWSHAVEAQAFDRVHRIGQIKEVRVDRLTIANTVEQRIGEMQERKKGLADASLGEGGGVKIGRLTVGELAGLFGLDAGGRKI